MFDNEKDINKKMEILKEAALFVNPQLAEKYPLSNMDLAPEKMA